MAKVWIDRSECRRPGRLPNVCLVCGAEADDAVRHNFVWHPRWTYWFLALGVIWVFFLHLATRQKMLAFVPLCPTHRRHWTRKTVLSLGGGVAILLLFFAFPVVYIEATRGTPSFPTTERATWLWLGWGVFCLVLAAILIHFVRRGVNVGRITPDEIRFDGAAPEFERALEAHRDEWDREQDEREERRRDRERDEREDRRRAKATHVVRAKPVRRGDVRE